ncbi:hypothetical protein [Allochromatium vinosum]|uniref:hypothetical protein n=1 Tax=Allochromatium vinosum TaxID=1049 RepID=UPI0019073346|nr:hypothetical protein [Allochromatium vinosum]MBK1654229.1 hypothetical protein [Allochromatium vinosum]
MQRNSRKYSDFADDLAKQTLEKLIASVNSPPDYQAAMLELGRQLGRVVGASIPHGRKCLIVSTAEDADYLASGVMESMQCEHEMLAAVFWNNHYSIYDASIAPIVHQFIQPGFEYADEIVVVKSIISTSCVIRTNILSLIESVSANNIYVVAPVIFFNAEDRLRSEFPTNISDKFRFVFFAVDEERTKAGNVIPGIGGQIYQLLGMHDQPARTGYLPNLVRRLACL